jgi:hypothetical protein
MHKHHWNVGDMDCQAAIRPDPMKGLQIFLEFAG